MPDCQLSIVIPAYNEAQRIGPTLDRIFAWLDTQSFGPNSEVIVVDDGSKDATVALCESRIRAEARLRVVCNETNRGKGYSVSHGVRVSHGEQVLFSDADLSTPIEAYVDLVKALETHDIAIGSRALPTSDLRKRQPLYREMMGRTFNLFVQTLVFPGIRDTQCGFKLFRREAALACFSRRKIDGFAFDVEVLYIARRLNLTVKECPVIWINDEASRVDPIRHSLQMIRDIAKIRVLHRERDDNT